MKTHRLFALVLTAALGLAAVSPLAAASNSDTATTIALKRITDRYALTKVRISSMLDQRLNPTPLPTNPPNPFYRPPDLPATQTGPGAVGVPGGAPGGPVDSTQVPAEADESDAGTLAKFVSALKVSGVTVLNGVSRLTLNQTLCKAGDIIPTEGKGHTVYIQVVKITAEELTLRLNDEQQVIRLRK